jgi:hypothetical protein
MVHKHIPEFVAVNGLGLLRMSNVTLESRHAPLVSRGHANADYVMTGSSSWNGKKKDCKSYLNAQ